MMRTLRGGGAEASAKTALASTPQQSQTKDQRPGRRDEQRPDLRGSM